MYRVNRVKTPATVAAEHAEGTELPITFVDYEPKPRELTHRPETQLTVSNRPVGRLRLDDCPIL